MSQVSGTSFPAKNIAKSSGSSGSSRSPGLADSSLSAKSFHTSILIVGGAYAGLSAVRSLVHHLNEAANHDGVARAKLEDLYISITMVEPRAGFLNILGIPRAIVDTKFAETQYVSFEQLDGIVFDQVVSNDEKVLNKMNKMNKHLKQKHVAYTINYIHGKVTHLDEKEARYSLVDSRESATISFDYLVLATGRDRCWPTTPNAFTTEKFVEEMGQAKADIEASQTISVIGAGAVGIEIAGDIKHYFPDKTVNLIHPHGTFPPEPLSVDFRHLVKTSLAKSGVNVILNSRIVRELPNGDLETTAGQIINSDLNYWCTYHKNNIEILSDSLKQQFVTPKSHVLVNEYLQVINKSKKLAHFFCIGDIVELPIIKSAGWAMYMGRQVAKNLVSHILTNSLVEPFPDLTQMPRGMVLVAGNGEIVSELSGEVELNHKGYTLEYQDYCMGKIRATLGV